MLTSLIYGGRIWHNNGQNKTRKLEPCSPVELAEDTHISPLWVNFGVSLRDFAGFKWQ